MSAECQGIRISEASATTERSMKVPSLDVL
jgi:hypothetical protein